MGACQYSGRYKWFNNMVIQMIFIGEESGVVDTMLDKVADFYEQDVDEMVGRLNSIIVGILKDNFLIDCSLVAQVLIQLLILS